MLTTLFLCSICVANADEGDRVNDFIAQTLRNYGNTEPQLLARLGKAMDRSTEQNVSAHDPNATFEIVSLTFDGIEAHVFHGTSPGEADKEFVIFLRVEKGSIPFGKEITIGGTEKGVVKELGKPMETLSEQGVKKLRYEDDSGYAFLEFSLVKGKIARMQIDITVD